jgi:hypothetical protein
VDWALGREGDLDIDDRIRLIMLSQRNVTRR